MAKKVRTMRALAKMQENPSAATYPDPGVVVVAEDVVEPTQKVRAPARKKATKKAAKPPSKNKAKKRG